MKKFLKFLKFLLILAIFLGGIAAMAYPFVANYLFENRQDSIVSGYESTAKPQSEQEKERIFKDAELYNKTLASGVVHLTDPMSAKEIDNEGGKYNEILRFPGTDAMAIISIPAIKVKLPVYHGCGDKALSKGAGHQQGTSFPIGGPSTHAVIAAHTGLVNAKMFDDLVDLKKGDRFYIDIVGVVHGYEVDQIKVIDPSDVSDLGIVKGKDYVTLVTCTPYGVNSHRLLVRGKRIPDSEVPQKAMEQPKKTLADVADSAWMNQYVKSLLIGLAVGGSIFLIFLIIALIKRKNRKKALGKRQKKSCNALGNPPPREATETDDKPKTS